MPVAEQRRGPKDRVVPDALALDLGVKAKRRQAWFRKPEVDGIAEIVRAKTQPQADSLTLTVPCTG